MRYSKVAAIVAPVLLLAQVSYAPPTGAPIPTDGATQRSSATARSAAPVAPTDPHLVGAILLTSSESDIRSAVAGASPGSASPSALKRTPHPKLFFTSLDLPRLRERMGTSPYKEMAQSMRRQSDSYLKQPLLKLAYDPSQGRPPERVNLLPAGAVRSRITSLAFTYLLTADRRYADRAAREMLNVASWPTWADLNLNGMEADLNTGDVSFGMATGYDWLYDVLSNEQRAQIRDALVSKGLKAYLRGIADPRKHFWVNAYHNWNAVVNGSMGIAALALAGEEPAADEALAQARDKIGRFFRSVGSDGGWDEGVGYWQYGMDHAISYLMALQHVTGADDGHFSRPGMRRTGYFPLYFTLPSGARTVPFSDNTSRGPVRTPVFYALASRYGDSAFAWYADRYAVSDPLGYVWRPENLPPFQPSSLEQAKLFSDVGWAALRNNWGDPEDAVFIAFKSGNLGANHSHLDLNDFVLYAYGDLLVSNAGTAPYEYRTFSKERNSIYGVSSRGHNTFLVNGEGQAPKSKGTITLSTSGTLTHLIGDASRAYGDRVKRFRRHMVFGGRYVVLLDDVAVSPGSSGDKLSWLLHTEAKLNVSGREFTIEGEKARLYGFMLSPGDASFEVRRGLETRRWANEPDSYLSVTTGAPLPGAAFLTVLYPARLSEGKPEVAFRRDGDSLSVEVKSSSGVTDKIAFRRTSEGWGLIASP